MRERRRPVLNDVKTLRVLDGVGNELTSNSVVSVLTDQTYIAGVEEINGEYVFVGAGQKDIPVKGRVDFLIIGTKYQVEKVGV